MNTDYSICVLCRIPVVRSRGAEQAFEAAEDGCGERTWGQWEVDGRLRANYVPTHEEAVRPAARERF